MVEVRSLPEILASLDERRGLDGLPYYRNGCFPGAALSGHRRVKKVWKYKRRRLALRRSLEQQHPIEKAR